MARAEQQVLMRAKKKGKLEKYGIVDIAADLKKIEEESEKAEKEKQEQRATIEALAMNIDYTPAEGDKKKDLKEVEVPKAEKVREKRKSTKDKIQQQDYEGESTLEGAEDESKEEPNGGAEKESERENKEQRNTRQKAKAKEEEKNSVDIEALALTGILSEADREQDLKEQEEPLETERVGKVSQPTETTIQQPGLEGKKKSKDQRKKDVLGGGRPEETEREQQASLKSTGKELAVEGVAQKSKEKDSAKKSPNRPKTGRGDKVEGQDRERNKEKPRKRDKSKNKERQRDKESEQDVEKDEDPDPASNSDNQS